MPALKHSSAGMLSAEITGLSVQWGASDRLSDAPHFFNGLKTLCRRRSFRRIFAVRLSSQGADGIFQTALASTLFFSPERAATAGSAAGALAITILPYTVIGPYAGVLIDRWSRRNILLAASGCRAVMTIGAAGALTLTGVDALLYGFILIGLSINRFFLVTLGVSLPHVVIPSHLVVANSVVPTCGTLAFLLGGALAYAARWRLPAGDVGNVWLLGLAASGYLVSMVLSRIISPDLLGPHRMSQALTLSAINGWRAVWEGLHHVAKIPMARLSFLAIAVSRCGFGVTTIMTILLCRNYFREATDLEGAFALLTFVAIATGVGFALAAIVTPRGISAWGPSLWLGSCLASSAAACFLVVGWLSISVVLAAAFILGFALQGIKICVDATLQRAVSDEYLGRVFANYDIVFNVAFVAAAGIAAAMLPMSGAAPTLVAGIAVSYIIATGFILWNARNIFIKP
ncbi:MAG: MFS transporter [Actinomycetota bacterium]